MALIWPEIENDDFMNTTETVQLIREISTPHQTLGALHYKGAEIAKTLELPWLNNARKKSCIPPGVYKVIRRRSDKHGLHFHVTGVPGRSMVLIHSANYVSQLEGCIAPGELHTDINADGLVDVTKSGPTMKKLLKILPQTFNLLIS